MSLLLLAGCAKSDNKKEDDKGDKLSLNELNITYVTSPLNVPSIVEKELGIFGKAMPGVKVNYKEITSGADQTQALASGDVDVAMLGGPAGYNAVKSGKHEITNGKGLIDAIICVATSEKFYNEHKDVIDKLMEGQKEIADYMANNEKETKDIVMKALSLDEEAYDTMYKMYDFSTEITDKDKEGFERTKNFMLDTKMIDKDIDINSLFIK